MLSLVQPVLRSPETGEVVSDVVLEWDSVPGASRYEVRVSTDQNFTTVAAQETSVATRWSPPVTLNNDQYWWQVRAYDSQGQTKDWAELTQRWQFERRWQFGDTTALDPERPALVYPTNGVAPVTDDPFFYEWRPVRLASEYKLQMGTDPNFSPTTFDECITKETTFTPATGVLTSGPLGCKPASAGTLLLAGAGRRSAGTRPDSLVGHLVVHVPPRFRSVSGRRRTEPRLRCPPCAGTRPSGPSATS